MEKATVPTRDVFAPTGWKGVALESVTMDVVDHRKEAAFYTVLLGWTLREDDSKRACRAGQQSRARRHLSVRYQSYQTVTPNGFPVQIAG